MQRLSFATLAFALTFAALGLAGASPFDGADMLMDELGDPTVGMAGALDPAARGAKLSLQFFDAVTGNPIPGATVTFLDDTVTTDDRGMAKLPFPRIPVEKDIVIPAIFAKDGRRLRRGESAPEGHKAYVTSEVPVHFMVGTVWFKRYSISPAMQPGKLRLVVDWGERPADLDAHLVKSGEYHISYRKMRSYRDRAFLDRDDTTSFGPETITIEDVDSRARYSFFVHDYTNRMSPASDSLSRSKARVLVYNANELMGTFLVPSGRGVSWKVLDIVNGYPVAAEAMSGSEPM